MKHTLYSRLIIILGFPIATMCTISLPLVLTGFFEPDPHPWNWLTLYIIDVVIGIALFIQLFGFIRRSPWNRLWTAAVGGYVTIAFGQMALEILLDLAGVQAAPIVAKIPILIVMSVGFLLGILQLYFVFYNGRYWK